MRETVEVIIATYNRPGALQKTLQALARQDMREFSIAVIDDCSPKPVKQGVRVSGFPVPVRILKTARNGGPAAARNLGVRTSDADVMLFVDDDVVPVPDFVRRHTEALQRSGPNSVSIGPLLAPCDWRPTPWNRWEAHTLAVEYERMRRGEYGATWRQFFTGNAAVRRDQFLRAGGFDESFTRAEDIEFAYRLDRGGANFCFEPRAIGWHYAERSLASWRRIPVQYAEFDIAIDRLHPDLSWDTVVRREQSHRHRLTKRLESVAATFRCESAISIVGVSTARAASSLGLHRVSNQILSVVFQIEYGRSRRRLLGRRDFNRPSTETV